MRILSPASHRLLVGKLDGISAGLYLQKIPDCPYYLQFNDRGL